MVNLLVHERLKSKQIKTQNETKICRRRLREPSKSKLTTVPVSFFSGKGEGEGKKAGKKRTTRDANERHERVDVSSRLGPKHARAHTRTHTNERVRVGAPVD